MIPALNRPCDLNKYYQGHTSQTVYELPIETLPNSLCSLSNNDDGDGDGGDDDDDDDVSSHFSHPCDVSQYLGLKKPLTTFVKAISNLNTLRLRQNSFHLADAIFKCIFLN